MYRHPSSGFELAAFAVFGAIAILGALGTVLSRSPIRAAVGLFAHILALAGLYLTLGAHFLGIIQLLVYAGAVVVLFVFVIMLLGPAATPAHDSRGLIARIVAGGATAYVGSVVVWELLGVRRALPLRTAGYGTLRTVGTALFTDGVVPFELIGVTLVIAVVGAFAVARGHHHRERPGSPENPT